MHKLLGVLPMMAAVCAACLGASAQPAPASAVPSTDPQYDEKGNLKRPADFRTWVFVGSNIARQRDKVSALRDLLNTLVDTAEFKAHAEGLRELAK